MAVAPNHQTVGDSNAASAWVATSTLPASTKKPLLRFIQRFPTLEFYKEDATTLESVEEVNKVKLPKWLRDIRQTLAFVMPHRAVWVQFDHSLSPILDNLGEMWYMLGLQGYANDEDREVLEGIKRVRLFPIGEVHTTGQSILAINLADPADQLVYEYNLENLWDDLDDGSLLDDSIREMFNSYADMFGHIAAIKIQNNGETQVINAKE